jgi:hypothetical protein
MKIVHKKSCEIANLIWGNIKENKGRKYEEKGETGRDFHFKIALSHLCLPIRLLTQCHAVNIVYR